MRVQALTLFLFLSFARCQPKENATFVDVPPPSGSAQMILPMASALPHVDNEPADAPRTPVLFRAGDSVEVEWQQSWWPAHVLEGGGPTDSGACTSMCSGACVDLKSDITNCGKCSNICGQDAGAIMGGGTYGCNMGTCGIICPMGKTECSGACVDTKTDIDNCGMCATACDPNTEQCTSGMCCKMGEQVCNGMCTNTQTDANNCGMCGMKCPMNMPSCGGGKCTSLYTFQGVQTNLPISMLTGWKQCYTDQYGTAMNVVNVASNCQGSYLLLGCMPNNANTLTVAATGLKSDVTFVTGNSGCNQNKTHAANGVEWYYDTAWSWGFLKQGDSKNLCSCDTDSTDPTLRLCWHASNVGGYRCGSTTGLNSNNTWTRVVYAAQ